MLEVLDDLGFWGFFFLGGGVVWELLVRLWYTGMGVRC